MILVTGGSGFIGLHLVGALLQSGEKVRALTHSGAGRERLSELASQIGSGPDSGLELIEGDLTDASSIEGIGEGCSVAYHLGGTYRGTPAELTAVHVAGTANLLEALPEGIRLVAVSSTSVYGWDRVWPADHATPPRPASPYGLAKLQAEQLVKKWKKGSWVIVRPTITYGPGDTSGMLARSVKVLKGPRWFPGTGANRIHLIHVDDLVAGLLLAGEKGDGIFVLCGPEAAPLRLILELLAEGAGLEPPRFGMPVGGLRTAAAAVEAAWSRAGFDGEPPLSRHSVEVATADRAYSCRRATDELGWQPAVTLEAGVPALGQWLVGPGAAATRRPTARGFDWRSYLDDPDEGLGTVYERFGLDKILRSAMERTGSKSVLHAPAFGMMGFPGLDAAMLARDGYRVGLLDFDGERLDAVAAKWKELGLPVQTHLVDGPDPANWPHELDQTYDLVFSFAALWWFPDPWAVVAAQARWAGLAVVDSVPNKNVFMRARARLWHRQLFDELNEEALDGQALTQAGQDAGLIAVDEGLFDMPPFPDTSVPIARVLRDLLGKKGEEASSEPSEGAWAWSILPYLSGDDPTLEERVERFGALERHMPAALAPHWAHHRYVFFVTPPASAGAPTQTA